MEAAAGGGDGAAGGSSYLTVSDMLQQVPESNLPNGFGTLIYTEDLIEPDFKKCWTLLHDSGLFERPAQVGDKNQLDAHLLKGFHGFLIGKVEHFEKKPESSPWVIAEAAVDAAVDAEVAAAKVAEAEGGGGGRSGGGDEYFGSKPEGNGKEGKSKGGSKGERCAASVSF